MPWLDFIARVVDALAWPTAIVVAVMVLRPQLRALLDGLKLRRLKIPGFEAEWERAADDVRVGLVNSSQLPSWGKEHVPDREAANRYVQAVSEAHDAIVAELQRILASDSSEKIDSQENAGDLARRAAELKLIEHRSVDTVRGMTIMRDLAARKPDSVGPEEAAEYWTLTEALLFTLRSARPGH